MFALPQNAKAGLFECPNRIEMIDAGIFGTSHRHRYFADILAFDKVVHSRQVFANGILNICERLSFSCALRPTPRKAGTRNAEAFFRFVNDNFIVHVERLYA